MLQVPQDTAQPGAAPTTAPPRAPLRQKLRLGDVLVQQNLVTADQLTAALAQRRGTGKRLGRLLIEAGIVTEEAVAHGLARQLRAPVVNLKSFPLKSDTVRLLGESPARRHRVVVLEDKGEHLLVGFVDPLDLAPYDKLTRLLKRPVRIAVVPESQLAPVLDRHYKHRRILRSGQAVGTGRRTIAVRAMPDELRQVELFLRASRLAIERQVMLEAKIIEVELRDGFQSGIDWSLLKTRAAVGQTSGLPGNALVTNPNGLPTLPAAVAGLLVDAVSLPVASGGALGLSLATQGFQAVMGFLETHGELQVLSSPRVATLNNQKAVLKVGVDEFFVTNVSGGTNTPGGPGVAATTTMPTPTLTSFFSGIALDVTPQIDEGHMITLHLRPSVTSVTEKTKQIDLGTIGNYRLPLASSSVNETDTVVRVQDGNIVAIGGLMQVESTHRASGLPGSNGNVVTRHLPGNTADSARKKELVVLIKPTIIRNAEDWQRSTDQALASFGDAPQRTIVVNAAPTAPAAAPAAPTPASVSPPAPTRTTAAPTSSPTRAPSAATHATPLAASLLPAAGHQHR